MTSSIVGPSATASESEKNGIPRLAFTEPSIGSTTTRIGAARAEGPLAELLRDEHEVRVERLEPGDDGILGGRVDRGRVVAALALPEHRLALEAGRQLARARLDVRDAVAAELEPVGGSYGVEEQAARQLGEEVRRLLRHHLAAARALEDVLDARRAQEERPVELAGVDARDRLAEVGRVAEPVVADEAVDELDVELARLARRRGT